MDSRTIRVLLQDHLKTPATLRHAASLLGPGRWLTEAVIDRIEEMGGEIPVQVPAGGSAFVIRFPRDPAAPDQDTGAYLALDRDLDAGQLRAALASGPVDPSVAQARIVGFALFPPAPPLPVSD